jgi:hypothetical protein
MNRKFKAAFFQYLGKTYFKICFKYFKVCVLKSYINQSRLNFQFKWNNAGLFNNRFRYNYEVIFFLIHLL